MCVRAVGTALLAVTSLLHGVCEHEHEHKSEFDGNSLCWYLSGKSYQGCCLQPVRDDCWTGLGYTEEFCCHALPQGYQQCFDDIEQRVFDKIATLEQHGVEDEARPMLAEHHALMNYLLSKPLELWQWACSAPASPFLWSPKCACCEPRDDGCVMEEQSVMVKEYGQCCFPIYARRTREAPDLTLERAIQAHLGTLQIPRGELSERGEKLEWQVSASLLARGCLISLRSDGSVRTCDETHACPGFDCSYLRAVVLTLEIIQAVNPLPDLDFVLNAADVSMGALDPLPIFTRVGTRWTNTLELPSEWQLHPGQCIKHLAKAINSVLSSPWENRESTLIWRGSTSNCRTVRCNMALASGYGTTDAAEKEEAMAMCGLLPLGENRDCIWNFTTWLQMPRGRLVWLSRFFPGIDAKFSGAGATMDSALKDFLLREGLFVEPMSPEMQGRYKYVIAVEGDSAADRVFWQLFSGSVVIIPDGPWKVYSVESLLEPYVHYVPVRYDLSDLIEKVSWLQQHDDEARNIARNAISFAQRYLTCDANVYFVERLLRAYAERLVD